MKNKYVLYCYLFLLLISTKLYAVEFNINAEIDETGKLNPSFSYFFDWDNDKFYYSGFTFKKVVSSKSDNIDGFSESKNVKLYDEYNLNLSFINYRYKINNISLITGVDAEFRNIENSEVGYFLLPPSLTGQWVSFDNNIKINAIMPGINGGVKMEKGIFKCDLMVKYIPFYYLGVKQKTYFRPIIDEAGVKKSNSFTSNAYELNTNIFLNLRFITPWLLLSNSRWTTDYDVKTLQYNSTTTSFNFDDKTESATYTESRAVLNLIINSESFFDTFKPYVGCGYRKQVAQSDLNDKKDSKGEWVVAFGIIGNSGD